MRHPTSATGGFLLAALVAGSLLGSALVSGCQREEAPQPGGQAEGPTAEASPPATAASPSPETAASPEAAPSPQAAASPAESPGAMTQASPPPAGGAAGGGDAQTMLASASVEEGQQLFMQNCATCHGNEGKGDGPAAAALNPKPQDLTDGEWKHGGSPPDIFNTITNGVPGTAMVSWASIPEEQRWALVKYVQSLSQK